MTSSRWFSALLVPVALTAALSLAPSRDSGADSTPSVPTTPDPRAGELVIFVQSSGSALEERFASVELPAIREVAARAGVAVRVVDVGQEGAPGEVSITPLLVYQNYLGRSIFQGRYASAPAVRNFLRTARSIPHGEEVEVKHDVAVKRVGRAVVVARPKVTEVAGTPPEGFDAEAFNRRAVAAVISGLDGYRLEAEVELGRADRTFYYDVYPYRSEDGQLFLSLALFSPFNCIDPIYRRFDEPLAGSWAERDALFARAGAELAAQVAKAMATSELGDGFEPVASSVAEVSWEGLGLALPPAPAGISAGAAAGIELGRSWVVEPAADPSVPRLQFQFLPPMDRYAGEVRELAGGLTVGPGGDLSSARGWMEVRTASVTMGLEALDSALHGKMLHVDQFPSARFDLEGIDAPPGPLAFGTSSQVTGHGTFQLLGVKVPLGVRLQIEPTLGDDGKPRLWVRGSAQLRILEPFGLKGPDGPSPANDTVVLYLDFTMAPA